MFVAVHALLAVSARGFARLVQIRVWMITMLATALGLGITSCGVSFAPLPAGSIAGRANVYDYSPSVIQTGTLQESWWCGYGDNPENRSQLSDTIQYQSIDLSTNARHGPRTVLVETPGAWDSTFACNPKVIRGFFANPLGDGENFSYAMYYVGIDAPVGAVNFIGVAFSNDGVSWKKYPHPVIAPETSEGYGVGQPAVYNSDRQGAIRMFYEDSSYYPHHTEAISRDGVHFTVLGILTTNGLDPQCLTWGDIAYDSGTGYWYAAFNTALRDPSTTGGVLERGQYGIKLYRIPDASLLTGNDPWELLMNFDTNLNGYEANFIAGFVRDEYGNLVAGSPIRMYTSVSNPPPPWDASPAVAGASGAITNWDISWATWTPGQFAVLKQYSNQATHQVTTGWVDPKGGFVLEATLGHLYQDPQSGATVPLFGCKAGSTDYFISRDAACEGARILGVNGYAYTQPVTGLNLVALYRCSSGHDHSVSANQACDGQTGQPLLGYILP